MPFYRSFCDRTWIDQASNSIVIQQGLVVLVEEEIGKKQYFLRCSNDGILER
ncbi:MAG: hypothetical protein ACFB2X_27300 [Rivularia sp. (in: cyanobacteria)]